VLPAAETLPVKQKYEKRSLENILKKWTNRQRIKKDKLSSQSNVENWLSFSKGMLQRKLEKMIGSERIIWQSPLYNTGLTHVE
jgi:hypothetical protein